jgi:pimeloyl-ACP methyl ester carboxylesterase
VTAENPPTPAAPDTIVLIHGLWVTPRSWEKWVEHYQGRGYRVLTPAYPGFEVEVEALNEDPSPIEAVTIPAVVEHLEGIVGELDQAPIIMGHSAGGFFTQVLLDHDYGAAGVAIDSAPAEGVRVTPVSQIKSLFPILKKPRQPPQSRGLHPQNSSTTPSPPPSAGRSRTRSTSATTSQRRAASCGPGPWPTSRLVTRTSTSTSGTKTGHRCCS